jgi:hypothetical protein
MKLQAVLPLCSTEMRYINVCNTSLSALVNACRAPGAPSLPRKEVGIDIFIQNFPGLQRFSKRSRYQDSEGEGSFLFQSFRTDGVCASLLFGKKHTHCSRRSAEELKEISSTKKRKREDKAQAKKGGTLVNREERPLPENARVVSIDPGRRDMLYAVVGSKSKAEARYKLPTAAYRKRCKTAEATELAEQTLKKVQTTDGNNLYSLMLGLPSCRDVFEWRRFLDAYLPLLPEILKAKRRRCLRRTRFDSYIRRDKVLDQVIKELLGGSLKASSNTFVALGNANACSTGFGHASAPQGRFYWRLHRVHKVEVDLVDEFRTSQVCHQCRIARLYNAKVNGKKTRILEACPNCRNPKGTGPRFWHHDLNGAMNIRPCFLEARLGHPRPSCFDRAIKDRLPNLPRDFHP